jgi:hypothetical protein
LPRNSGRDVKAKDCLGVRCGVRMNDAEDWLIMLVMLNSDVALAKADAHYS